jgi:hypothetical protein
MRGWLNHFMNTTPRGLVDVLAVLAVLGLILAACIAARLIRRR